MRKEEIILNEVIKIWKEEYPFQSISRLKKYTWKGKVLEIDKIYFSKPRNINKAKEYLSLIEQGIVFPPIVVIFKSNGKYRLIDGFHRMWAYKQLGKKEVNAFVGIHTKKHN